MMCWNVMTGMILYILSNSLDESQSVSAPTEPEPELEQLSSCPPLGWKTCYETREDCGQSKMNSNANKPFIARNTARRSTSKVKDLQNLFLRGGGGATGETVARPLNHPPSPSPPQCLLDGYSKFQSNC